jgi:serine/threonine protein kinase
MDHRLEPGTRLGAFEILEPLGAGGMGEVYRARDTRLGRDVALKTLSAPVAGQPTRLARLRKEARILAARNHPHIATVFGLEEIDGAAVIVMELVEGPTLHDRLRLNPPGVRESLELARQVAAGLEAAHEKGILHRDLKPANIVIDAKGQVKLLDFGLAMAADEELAASRDSTATAVERVEVVLEKKWHRARVDRVEDDFFYFIQYDDLNAPWSEWLTADRMRPLGGGK